MRALSRRSVLAGAGAGLVGALGPGCARTPPAPPASIGVLYDASKTYSTTEVKRAALEGTSQIVRAMRPGGRLAFIRVGECSFSDRAVLIDRTLPERSDASTAAKLALLDEVERLRRRLPGEDSTDITGALWQAHRLFDGQSERRQVLIVFSDLEEDVATSACRGGRDALPDLTGAHVLLAGVTGLAQDRGDPTKFFERVEAWATRFTDAGAASAVRVAGGPDRLRAAVEPILSAPA